MKTNINFLSYLAQFFLEWEIFQTQAVEKIKKHILCPVTFFSRRRAVYEITWKKYDKAGQDTDDSIIRHMRVACWTLRPQTHTKIT
jgi:hypothetical protein